MSLVIIKSIKSAWAGLSGNYQLTPNFRHKPHQMSLVIFLQ
jgi:hypothetical protein